MGKDPPLTETQRLARSRLWIARLRLWKQQNPCEVQLALCVSKRACEGRACLTRKSSRGHGLHSAENCERCLWSSECPKSGTQALLSQMNHNKFYEMAYCCSTTKAYGTQSNVTHSEAQNVFQKSSAAGTQLAKLGPKMAAGEGRAQTEKSTSSSRTI